MEQAYVNRLQKTPGSGPKLDTLSLNPEPTLMQPLVVDRKQLPEKLASVQKNALGWRC